MSRRSHFLHEPEELGPLTGTLLVVWHGAGGDVDHPTLMSSVRGFVDNGAHAIRARFPYRVEGRNAPDRMPKLMASARSRLARVRSEPPLAEARLVLGGRSMGGRMASMLIADGYDADGLILFSYPLHPVGKKDKLRDAHLTAVRCPILFLQGAKDNMADLSLLRPLVERLGRRARLEVFDKGDHGMKKVDPEAVGRAALEWALGL